MKIPVVLYRRSEWFLSPTFFTLNYQYYVTIGKFSWFKKLHMKYVQKDEQFDIKFEKILLIYEE